MVRKFYRLTAGAVPIIGCGGITTGEDAIRFIEAGASAVQLYTALSYEGPGIVRRIKDELSDECRRRRVSSISDLIGASHK
jgi:dihydroorotate dehydrogenase